MIKSWKHKGLKELAETGRTSKIQSKFHARVLERLDAMNAAKVPSDLHVPGYDFHALNRSHPIRYTIHVNGPWCLTFEFDGPDVVRVDFEQYH